MKRRGFMALVASAPVACVASSRVSQQREIRTDANVWMRRDENGAYEICEYKLENGMCTYTQEEYIKNLEYFGNPPITIDKFGMALPVWNVGR